MVDISEVCGQLFDLLQTDQARHYILSSVYNLPPIETITSKALFCSILEASFFFRKISISLACLYGNPKAYALIYITREKLNYPTDPPPTCLNFLLTNAVTDYKNSLEKKEITNQSTGTKEIQDLNNRKDCSRCNLVFYMLEHQKNLSWTDIYKGIDLLDKCSFCNKK